MALCSGEAHANKERGLFFLFDKLQVKVPGQAGHNLKFLVEDSAGMFSLEKRKLKERQDNCLQIFEGLPCLKGWSKIVLCCCRINGWKSQGIRF